MLDLVTIWQRYLNSEMIVWILALKYASDSNTDRLASDYLTGDFLQPPFVVSQLINEPTRPNLKNPLRSTLID